MEEENPMWEFLFGEAAETVRRGASEQLKRWCQAYGDWLAERKQRYGASTIKQSKLAWRRLLRQVRPGERRMLWELTEEDIASHAAWMQAERYSPATISNALGILSNFYEWFSERRIDPGCETDFNPAKGVSRPKVERYREAKLLSRGELARLLRTMQSDPSELGKRDHAFTLARLRLGVPLKSLQRLKWGQIEREAGEAWVRWRTGAERQHLPEEVWEAIQAALAAGGRLEGMQAGDFIFAPLIAPLKAEAGSRPEDWAAERPLSSGELLMNLKIYGRLAGIPGEKMTLLALRRTAMRLRLDEGASLREMQAFLGSQEGAKFTKCRLGKLPQLPSEGGGEKAEEEEVRVPERKAKPFRPGEGVIHGFYARSLPPEAAAAVLRENIQGMGEEIVSLRILERGIVERQDQARSNQERARLGEAYSLTALRLGEVIKAENERARNRETTGRWAEEFLERMDQMMIERGEGPISELARAEALGGEAELEAGARSMVEEIALMRYCLRNVFGLAIETEDMGELIHYTELYSSWCTRLAKLLRMERSDSGRLEASLKDQISQALQEVNEERGPC